MPLLNADDVEQVNNGHFGYSAVKLDSLEETGYSLATLVVDRSGSTDGFAASMAAAMVAVVEAVKHPKFNPRADNVLLRVLLVDSQVHELHGFLPVASVDTSGYEAALKAQGMTAFYDGLVNAAEGMFHFGQRLHQSRFTVNGIIIAITDGANNAGRFSRFEDVVEVAKAFRHCTQAEALESMDTFLIGVNTDNSEMQKYLNDLHSQAMFSRPLVKVAEASKANIAKLGLAISESISSASQALGTGGPSQAFSQNLTF